MCESLPAQPDMLRFTNDERTALGIEKLNINTGRYGSLPPLPWFRDHCLLELANASHQLSNATCFPHRRRLYFEEQLQVLDSSDSKGRQYRRDQLVAESMNSVASFPFPISQVVPGRRCDRGGCEHHLPHAYATPMQMDPGRSEE